MSESNKGRPAHNKRQFDVEQIIKDHEFGISSRKIALKHNTGKTCILRIISPDRL